MSGATHRLPWAVMALSVSCLIGLGGCANSRLSGNLEDQQEAEEFREMLLEDGKVVKSYIRQTENGENVSEMSLGWLVMNILTSVSAEDKQLQAHFKAGGQDVESYLETTFSDHPEQEIAQLDQMMSKTRSSLCPVARYALESLRHIPDSREPVSVQAEDRMQLVAALANLDQHLERAAKTVQIGSAR